MQLTGLTGAKAGAPPSSPTELCTVMTHSNNKKIVTVMTEEDGGVTSVMMVAVDNNGGWGGRRPNRRRWRLEVVLPSPALPPSHKDCGSRGAQKPVARRDPRLPWDCGV